MTVFFITLAVLLIVVAVMAIGVICQNKPIKGSCGGMAALGIDTKCDICGGDTKKCEDESERVAREAKKESSEDLAYDAS